MIDERKGDWMQTFTGRQFWPMDPRPEEVFLEDIAHSLSLACRYAGHCIRFYSVAEHSVLMSRYVLSLDATEAWRLWAAKWALLHDASEAYLVDVPRPVKPFLAGYRDAEGAVMRAIQERFGVEGEDMPRAVKDADNSILVDESRQNMHSCVAPWYLPYEPLGVTLHCWSPEEAERQFTALASELGIS